jgi:hypothetical protein
MSEQNERFQNKLSTSEKKGKRKMEYCDLEGYDEIICDYEKNGASIISNRVTIPEINCHLNLVGKALCRKHYNKLIVNAKKTKNTNVCSHPKHEIYLPTAQKRTASFKKAPERLIRYFKLSKTAVMCHHCLLETDRDSEYLGSSSYLLPIKRTSKENIQRFQDRAYVLHSDVIYSEQEFQELESAYHEVCAELDEVKLGE